MANKSTYLAPRSLCNENSPIADLFTEMGVVHAFEQCHCALTFVNIAPTKHAATTNSPDSVH